MIQSVDKNLLNQQAISKAATRAQSTEAAASVAAAEQQAAQTNPAANLDTLTTGTSTNPAGVYSKADAQGSATTGKLNKDELKAINEQQVAQFNKMLQGMLGSQASVSNISKASFANLKVSPQEQAAAKAAISEGGEWSEDAVSGRILDMAKALSGGDASKFETLKNAVKKGFKEAEKQWGGKMPEITQKTFDKVMSGFDEWEKELNGTSSGSTNKPTTLPATER